MTGHRRPAKWGKPAALAAGSLLLAAGGFLAVRALTAGPQLPPAAAQSVPAAAGSVPPPAPGAPGKAPGTAAAAPGHPVRLVIPAIGVNAPVGLLGLNRDRTVQVPPLADHNLAGWYDGSSVPGLPGPAVILGHVDSYQGPSVFYRLKNLARGDTVTVVLSGGTSVRFAVDGVQAVAKSAFPTAQVYGRTAYPALRLVTCGGPFDVATGSYQDSVIAYAHLVPVK